jgi:hypothetical protein
MCAPLLNQIISTGMFSGCGLEHGVPRHDMTAQAIRAILFAKAITATRQGFNRIGSAIQFGLLSALLWLQAWPSL